MLTRRQALSLLGTTGIGTATLYRALAATAGGAEAVMSEMVPIEKGFANEIV